MDLPAHQLTMTVPMTPDMANFAGNMHGGTILKFLDQVAYACASRFAKRYVVTHSVDQLRICCLQVSDSLSDRNLATNSLVCATAVGRLPAHTNDR